MIQEFLLTISTYLLLDVLSRGTTLTVSISDSPLSGENSLFRNETGEKTVEHGIPWDQL